MIRCLIKLKIPTNLPILIILFVPFCVHPFDQTIRIDLDSSYDLAIKNSLELRTTRYQLEQERIRHALGIWQQIPSLEFQISDSREVRYDSIDSGSISIGTSLSVPVFSGGRTYASRLLKKKELDFQNLQLNNAVNELRISCFSDFYSLFFAEEKLYILKDTQEIIDKNYLIAQKEFELGKIRELDILEMEAELISIQQQIFAAETEYISLGYNFKKKLGLDQDITLQLDSTIDIFYIGNQIENKKYVLITGMLRNNLSLLQLNLNVQQKIISQELSNSSWLPNISLQGSINISGETIPFQNPKYGVRAIFEFPYELLPISISFGISNTPDLEYGRSASLSSGTPKTLDYIVDRKLSIISLELALQQKEAFEKDLIFQLEQLAFAYSRLIQQQKLLQLRYSIHLKKMQIVKKQLEIGQITSISFLENENELLALKLELLSGAFEILMKEKELETITGIKIQDLYIGNP